MGWFRKSRNQAGQGREIESWRPARYGDRKSYRRRLMLSYVAAGLIHSTIFVLTSRSAAVTGGSLNTAGVTESPAEADTPVEMPATLAARPLRERAINVSFHAPPAEDGPVDGTAGMDEDQLKALADEQQRRIEQMSAEEQDAELRNRMGQLNRMDEKDVNAALGVVESMMGIPSDVDHKMRPDASATGEFDAGSMVLHDVVKRRSDSGAVVYDYVWVDKAGRTMTQERASAELDPDEKRMAGIYEMARENPLMRPLLDSVLKMELSRHQENAKGR